MLIATSVSKTAFSSVTGSRCAVTAAAVLRERVSAVKLLGCTSALKVLAAIKTPLTKLVEKIPPFALCASKASSC